MAEDVLVDFTRVEKALDIIERERGLIGERERAQIARERAEVATRLIKYSAAACALIIVSIGIAIWLSRQRHMIETIQPTVPPKEVIFTPPKIPDVPANKIKSNVSQFNTIDAKDLKIFNPFLLHLAAGHRYSTSNSDRWDSAWCYAMFWRDGLTYRVELEDRMGSAILPKSVSSDERQRFGLSDSDITYLRTRCPWKPQ